MRRIGLFALSVALFSVAGTVYADPGDVNMPDSILETAVEAIIGSDGISGAVDGNWLVGDGGSSAGAGLNDPDGLTILGLDPIIGATDLTGMASATSLEALILVACSVTSLAPLADLPALEITSFINCDVDDADVADLLGGTAPIQLLNIENTDEAPGTFNNITTTGVTTIGGKAGMSEIGLLNMPSALDISGLASLDLGGGVTTGLGLDLTDTEVSAGIEILDNFTNVTALSLGGTGIDDTEFASVDWSQFTSLEALRLTENTITDLTPLATLPANLVELDLTGNVITTGLTVIENFVNLDILILNAMGLGDAGVAAIDWSVFTNLATYLALIGNGIEDITPLTNLAAPSGLTIYLLANTLDLDSVCTDIPTLEAAGYVVEQDIGVCGPLVTVIVDGVGAVNPDTSAVRVMNGSDVVYSAAPVADSGYGFEGWYDTTAGAPGTLVTADTTVTYNVTADTELTARFTNTGVNSVTVQASGLGTGVVMGVPDYGTFSYLTGTELSLTVAPDMGSYFGGYSGDLSGFDFTQNLTLDSDKTVTALFADSGFTVTIFAVRLGVGPDPLGITVPPPGDYPLVAGADLSISAFSIDAAWRFSNWQDNSTAPVFNIADLQADTTVTAFFEEITDQTLTMIVDGNGSTTPAGSVAPGTDYTYANGTSVTVTATPNSGNVFDSWSGDLPVGVDANDSSFTFNIISDVTLTATFVPGDTALTINAPVGNGTTDPVPGTYDFLDTETAMITAIPNDASTVFQSWSGDVPASDVNNATLELLMDQNRSITANFADADYTLTLSLTGTGTINRATGDSGWRDGDTVILAVVPTSGSDAFEGWYDVTSGAPGTLLSGEFAYQFDIASDISIEARFVTPDVTLTVVNDNPGLGLTNLTGTFGFLTGDVITLLATPNTGNFFDGWTGDVTSGTPVIDVTMDANKTIHAAFDTSGFNVTIAIVGMGNTQPPAGTYAVTDGTVFTAKAQAFVVNNVFDTWNATGVILTTPTDETQNVTVSGGDITLTANFVEVIEPELTIAVAGNGTTSPPAGTTTRALNEEVVLTAIPNAGSAFTGWTGDIGGANAGDTTISVIMNQDRSVTANFAEYDWYLTIQVSGTGTTSPLPGQYGHFEGDMVNLSAIDINGSGFTFQQWTGDIGGATATDASISVTMDQSRQVTAVFGMSGEGEGEGEGEGPMCTQGPVHTADQDGNNQISLNELLRIIQFFNSGGFGCEAGTEDGYAPNDPDQDCCPHDSDYNPGFTASWSIDLTELLRLIQFFNSGGYNFCPLSSTEDNYCPGLL